jgi:hypothetical protein
MDLDTHVRECLDRRAAHSEEGYFYRGMDFKSFHKLRPNPPHMQMINNGMHI